MDGLKRWALFNILLAVCFYFVVYTISGVVTRDFLLESHGSAFCNLISALITLPFIIFFFYRTAKMLPFTVQGDLEQQSGIKKLLICIFFIALIAASSVAINLLFTRFLPFLQTEGFSEARNDLMGGELFVLIMSNVIVSPVLEELLYRGTVQRSFEAVINPALSIIFSSLLFGLFHFNLLQFLYSFCCGLIIGFSYKKTGVVAVPVIGHAAANLIVVLNSVL
ncbi:MAG: CPBP family intramembrane metalloprotease [Lachnospiraceae bacterium]|nr:CPBP family intramembrane metalloprotease [Lachnospiraceae bacterium]MCR5211563.1 CPBP family intramembrane metalloprotease [Lachnospiraceae bacterium]